MEVRHETNSRPDNIQFTPTLAGYFIYWNISLLNLIIVKLKLIRDKRVMVYTFYNNFSRICRYLDRNRSGTLIKKDTITRLMRKARKMKNVQNPDC